MSALPIALKNADALRRTGRQPGVPFAVSLHDGSTLSVYRLLRVLPGKRIVGEGQWQDRRVLVKLFVDGRSEQGWAREKCGLEILRQAGVPTPEMCYADPLPGGGHVLLTVFLDAAETLAERWSAHAQGPTGGPEAIALLAPAFHLLGQLHAAGAIHEDLHFGNFLFGAEGVFLVDGDAVRLLTPGKTLDASRARYNLALLLAQLPLAWEAHQTAILAAYAAGSGMAIGDPQSLAEAVGKARRWRLNDYLGKSLRDCSLFAVRRSANRFCAVRRSEASALEGLLPTLDASIRGGERLKDGNTCTVARVDLSDRAVVVKRYNLKGFWHALGRLWRPSRAWHSWREGHRLRVLGIDTPEPLALIEERFGPLRRRAYLINAFSPGISLAKHLAPEHEPDPETAQAILALFDALQRARISHGDLKASNLLWVDGRVSVIDLDAMTQHASAHTFVRAWRRDRARLLENWPAGSPLRCWLDRKLPPADHSRAIR